MDNMLIKIEERIIGDEKVQAVNARELHERLGVETKFADWINRRLTECQASENIDFIGFLKSEKAENTYINTKEYFITLDIAKHISMLERTDTGRQIRQYFIDVEKQFKVSFDKKMTENVLTNDEKAARAFEAYKKIGELAQLPPNIIISEAAKIIDRKYETNLIEFTKSSPLLDHVKEENEYLEPTDIGKKIGISSIALNKKLATMGLQYKENGSWIPTDEGKKYCYIHQWTTGKKSGYNLKWNVNEIIKRLQNK